jgi:hypothetical protein
LSLLDNVSLDLQISCFSLQLDVTVIFPTAFSKPRSEDATMKNSSKGFVQQVEPLVMAGKSEFIQEAGAKIILPKMTMVWLS